MLSRENNVISLLDEHIQSIPDKKAFISNQGSITYNDFAYKISSLASNLKKLKLKKGDTVLIFIPLSIELYICMFAVQQIGAVAVFLDSWARKDQLSMCVDISKAKGIISFNQAFEFCKDISAVQDLPIKLSIEDLEFNNEDCDIEPVNLDDTALITFTTGSSGKPKGANRTHRFLFSQHKALKNVLPYENNEIDLPVFPIFALNNLASGITTLIPNINLASPSEIDGKLLTQQILSQKTFSTTLSPSLFIKVSDYCIENNIKLDELSRVVTGGAPISRENVINFKKIAPNAKILILYGSTEVEPIAHIEGDDMLLASHKDIGVNVGKIDGELKYKILKITKDPIEITDTNWNDLILDQKQVGELVVSGNHVCKEYYNDKEAFKKAKIKDLEGNIWHRTGDVGFIDEDGFFWFVGRVHNVIYRNNTPIYPLQAELALKNIEGVTQSAFLGLQDHILGEKTVAVISLKDSSAPINTDDIKKLLLDKNITVDEVKIVDSIPMDPRHHSKVEYNKLREILS